MSPTSNAISVGRTPTPGYGAQLDSVCLKKVSQGREASSLTTDDSLSKFQYLSTRQGLKRTKIEALTQTESMRSGHILHQDVVMTIPFTGAEKVTLVELQYSLPVDQPCAWEVWAPHEEVAELGLKDSVYVGLDHFSTISKQTLFSYGVGLPGLVWKHGRPIIMQNLVGNHEFLRKQAAGENGLSMAIGFPVSNRQGDLCAVLVWLLDASSALKGNVEVWEVSENASTASGYEYQLKDHTTQQHASSLRTTADLEILEDAVLTKMPVINSQLAVNQHEETTALHGRIRVALPTFRNGKVNAVLLISK